ncbi:MAG: hypothetical protein KAV87_15130 [Desulfobacteraceae bacterium]|nr:hypothetical protein [Desulfobacteraceae bacterium]
MQSCKNGIPDRPPLITDRSSFDEAAINDLILSQDAIALKVVVGDLP